MRSGHEGASPVPIEVVAIIIITAASVVSATGAGLPSPSSSSSLPSPATTSRGADESGGEALLLILADLACGGGAGEVPFARQCCEELEMPKNQTYLDLNHIVSLRSGHIPAVRPRPRLVSVSCDKPWVEAFDDEKRPSP